MVTIDCAEPQQLAAFWSEALGVSIQGDYGDFVFLGRPVDGGPVLGLQRGYPNHAREEPSSRGSQRRLARH